MASVLQLLDEQFGRILLAVALVWAVLATTQNGPLTLEPISQKDLTREVQVSLNAAKLPAAIKEQYFMLPNGAYAGPIDHFIFVPEKKLVEFKSVSLDVPTSNVMPPPQLLPEPGPMLESTVKLPRYGDEFPPLKLDDPKNKEAGTVPIPAPGPDPVPPPKKP